MRNFPIDINAFMAMLRGVSDIDPVVDRDTGEHRTDRDGVPRWRLEVLVREPGQVRSQVVHIGFSSRERPVIDHTGELVITGLVGRHWENTNQYGTSSGVALSADTVAFKPANRPNGRPSPARTDAAA